jgi:hypothetical protein
MRPFAQRAAEWYAEALRRAQRRRSAWNFILIPLGLAGRLGVWYGLFRLVWAFHVTVYPQHRLHDFWGEGVSFSVFMLSFLMVFAPAPGAMCLGYALANCAAWLVAPARHVFDAEAVGYTGASFREATGAVFKLAAWTLPAGLAIALLAAWALGSLR